MWLFRAVATRMRQSTDLPDDVPAGRLLIALELNLVAYTDAPL